MDDIYSEMKERFKLCQRTITAIGDEVRQGIIIALLEGGNEGMRVGALTEKTHLSRPAISHHLKILCDANLITVRKQGTMNFYRLNPDRREITSIYDISRRVLELMDEFGIGE